MLSMTVVFKLVLCMLGWLCHGSAVELATRRGEVNLWLDLQLLLGLGLILFAVFL